MWSSLNLSLACLDGALHIWQTSSNFVRPNSSIEGAHVKGTETGSLVFSVDGRTVLTRGGDDTVKCKLLLSDLVKLYIQLFFSTVWDLRAFKKPLATRSDLATLYPNTNAMFSPDDKYIITGAGATAKGGKGKLMFLDKNGLDVVKTLEVDATPVKVYWHSKINQVRGFMIRASEVTQVRADFDGALERPDMCAVLAADFPAWCQVAGEQRSAEKGDHRRHVGCAGRPSYSCPGRDGDVPGRRWDY